MRNTLGALLLAVACSNAVAAWVAVSKTSDNLSTIYADLASLHKADNKVSVRYLIDHAKSQRDAAGNAYRSETGHKEYDCKLGTARVLDFSVHTASMGGGTSSKPGFVPNQWLPVPPGRKSIWKLACGSKS